MEPSAEARPRAESWWPSLIAVALFVALLLGAYAGGLVLPGGQLAGPDSYMWLYLVETAHASGEGLLYPLHGMESPRSNAPHGETLHWTLPFFALLYVPAWLAALLPGVTFPAALFAWGVLVGPLLLGASVLVMAWGMQPLLRPGERFIVTLFLLMNAGVLLGFQVARPDHQALSLFLIAVAVAVGIRVVLRSVVDPVRVEKPIRDGRIWLLAAVLAISIWVSVEGLILYVIFNAALVLAAWLERRWLYLFRLMSVMFFSVAIALLFVLVSPVSYQTPQPVDALGDAHLYLLFGLSLLWMALLVAGEGIPTALQWKGPWRTVVKVALFMTPVFLFWEGIGALLDPYSTMDGRVRDIWQQGVVESRPLWQSFFDAPGMIVIFLFPALAGLWLCFRQWRKGEAGERPAWVLLGVGIAAYAGVCFLIQQRFFVQANLLAAGPFALLVWRGLKLADKPMPLLKAFAVGNVFVVTGAVMFLLFGKLMGDEELTMKRVQQLEKLPSAPLEESPLIPEPPRLSALTAWMNAQNESPGTILAFINIGPELLYRTPHAVVSTPYHRNNAGILDEWTFFTTLPEAYPDAETLARERGATHVLVRPFHPEEEAYYHQSPGQPKQRLWDDLAADSPPPWLVEIPLPEHLRTDYRLYRTRFSE